MTKEEIMAEMRRILVHTFEVPEKAISPSADLFDDLDLDSIDAVDLVIMFGQKMGKQLDQEPFQSTRTVGEAVDALYDLAARS